MGVRPVGVTLGSLSKYFPQQQIEAILRASGREGTRRRKLPTLELMYYVIALGLHASEACRSVLRRITVRKRLAGEDVFEAVCSAAAITQGRKRLGWQPIRDLYQAVVGPLATRNSVGAWYRRWRLVVLDGSVLDVADTQKNERAFGRPVASRGKSGFPQLRFVTLLESGTHVMFGAEMAGYRTGEPTLAHKVIKSLPADALCLADRAYFSYSLWKEALATGAQLLWRVRDDFDLAEAPPASGRIVPDQDLSLTGCAIKRSQRNRSTTHRIPARRQGPAIPAALLDSRSAKGSGDPTGQSLPQTMDDRNRPGRTEDSPARRTCRSAKPHSCSGAARLLRPSAGSLRRASSHARGGTGREDRGHRSVVRPCASHGRPIPAAVCFFFSLGRRNSSDHSYVSWPRSGFAIARIATLRAPSNAR